MFTESSVYAQEVWREYKARKYLADCSIMAEKLWFVALPLRIESGFNVFIIIIKVVMLHPIHINKEENLCELLCELFI